MVVQCSFVLIYPRSGAQVAVTAFGVNYLVDQNIGIDQSQASQLFSYCQITFTVGR